MKTALLIVDIQQDFCPGGALGVEEGDRVVEPANRWPIFFTRDWHPANHCSFAENGGPWPPHCIAKTAGAAFHPDLCIPEESTLVSKATQPDQEAYSGFEGTDLKGQLDRLKIESVVVAGLATDYCVKKTALDAHRAGFQVTVATDAIRGVNVVPEDARRAIIHMQVRGVNFAESADLINRLGAKEGGLFRPFAD